VICASASNDGTNFWHTFLDADDKLQHPTAPVHKTKEFVSHAGVCMGTLLALLSLSVLQARASSVARVYEKDNTVNRESF
jgi:hypothetical protein